MKNRVTPPTQHHENIRAAIHRAILNCKEVKTVLKSLQDQGQIHELCQYDLILRIRHLVRMHDAREICQKEVVIGSSPASDLNLIP